MEARCLAAWKEVLGLDHVGVTDDFFELGGDSYQAIRVVQRLPGKLSLLDLLRNPTVRGLATQLAVPRAEGNGMLVHFPRAGNHARSRLTLICIPYGGGSAIVYRHLARALPDEYDVYAVALPGHEPNRGDEPLRSIEEIAAACVDEVQTHVDGPVALYGHCAGGALTIELARRFELRGGTWRGLAE